ncbi:hypothetical protein [Vibrio tapetis]|uniref:Uncharacterized protein n=1 Tax=Vibrio tapetis subsp. tapetis TaxID=1671868 RepID=A0A2N8ZM76_9VIBR|nr:hypothetical protein [Vibrio tapetis]SON53023.1 exported protein of unknown function [Vibrio tapetis subsp. tapetis]
MGQKTSLLRLLMLIAIVGGFAYGIYQSLSGDFNTLIYVAIASVGLFFLLLIKNLIFGERNDNVNYKPMFKVPHDEPKIKKSPVSKKMTPPEEPLDHQAKETSAETDVKTETPTS